MTRDGQTNEKVSTSQVDIRNEVGDVEKGELTERKVQNSTKRAPRTGEREALWVRTGLEFRA